MDHQVMVQPRCVTCGHTQVEHDLGGPCHAAACHCNRWTSEPTLLPGLDGRPLILVHLEDPPGSGLTACTGQHYRGAGEDYPDVPRVACTGCTLADRRRLGLVAP